MGEYTKYGLSIWHWEPFVSLSYPARNLWNGLYTSGHAKRRCPGLWHGDFYAMASAAKMHVDEVVSALEELMAKKMVEFDRRHFVLVMTMLPDAGERPVSWKALKGMWNGFITVPPCAVRNRYPQLIKWLIEQVPVGSSVNPEMKKMWEQTFGTITIPDDDASHYVLTDSDTSTAHQPSLFGGDGQKAIASPKPALLLPSAMTFDSVSIPQGEGRGEGEEREEDLERVREREEEEARREVEGLGLRLSGSVEPVGPVEPVRSTERKASSADATGLRVGAAIAEVVDHATERQNALREVLAEQGMLTLLTPPKPARPADTHTTASGPTGKLLHLGPAIRAAHAVAPDPEYDPSTDPDFGGHAS